MGFSWPINCMPQRKSTMTVGAQATAMAVIRKKTEGSDHRLYSSSFIEFNAMLTHMKYMQICAIIRVVNVPTDVSVHHHNSKLTIALWSSAPSKATILLPQIFFQMGNFLESKLSVLLTLVHEFLFSMLLSLCAEYPINATPHRSRTSLSTWPTHSKASVQMSAGLSCFHNQTLIWITGSS